VLSLRGAVCGLYAINRASHVLGEQHNASRWHRSLAHLARGQAAGRSSGDTASQRHA
jgi:hypothetical protein